LKLKSTGSSREASEKEIENSILQWLSLNGIYAWKVNNVGVFDPIRKVYRKAHSPYIRKGIADILGILPDGRLLAIEVKSASGRLSPEQKDFLMTINQKGGLGIMARSLTHVMQHVQPVFCKSDSGSVQ
jgi:hypothetical protein